MFFKCKQYLNFNNDQLFWKNDSGQGHGKDQMSNKLKVTFSFR